MSLNICGLCCLIYKWYLPPIKAICKWYSTIETKEAVRIGYTRFLFQKEYPDEGWVHTHLNENIVFIILDVGIFWSRLAPFISDIVWTLVAIFFLFLNKIPTNHKHFREPSNEHIHQVWFQLAKWFRKRRLKCEKHTEDDGPKTDDTSSHDSLGRWTEKVLDIWNT